MLCLWKLSCTIWKRQVTFKISLREGLSYTSKDWWRMSIYTLINYKIFKADYPSYYSSFQTNFLFNHSNYWWLYNQYCIREILLHVNYSYKRLTEVYYYYYSISHSKDWWLTLLSCLLVRLKLFYPSSSQAHHSPVLSTDTLIS